MPQVKDTLRQMESDPWSEGAHLCSTGFSPNLAQRLPDDDGTDPVFGNRLTTSGPKALNIKEILKNPDPEIVAELSSRDPNFREYFIDDLTKRVGAEFRAANPAYRATDRNVSTLLKCLGKRHLEGSEFLDNDQIMDALAEQGHFTVANLTAAYRSLLTAGKLDVPAGQTRALTKQERLDVLSMIRVGEIENAVSQYAYYAFGGNLPHFDSPRDFLRSYPQLASEAAMWVWSQNRTDITPEDFRAFRAVKLNRIPVLTIGLINQAWDEYRLERKAAQNIPPEPEPLTRNQIDELPEEEFNNLRTDAIRNYLKARRS